MPCGPAVGRDQGHERRFSDKHLRQPQMIGTPVGAGLVPARDRGNENSGRDKPCPYVLPRAASQSCVA